MVWLKHTFLLCQNTIFHIGLHKIYQRVWRNLYLTWNITACGRDFGTTQQDQGNFADRHRRPGHQRSGSPGRHVATDHRGADRRQTGRRAAQGHRGQVKKRWWWADYFVLLFLVEYLLYFEANNISQRKMVKKSSDFFVIFSCFVVFGDCVLIFIYWSKHIFACFILLLYNAWLTNTFYCCIC